MREIGKRIISRNDWAMRKPEAKGIYNSFKKIIKEVVAYKLLVGLLTQLRPM